MTQEARTFPKDTQTDPQAPVPLGKDLGDFEIEIYTNLLPLIEFYIEVH